MHTTAHLRLMQRVCKLAQLWQAAAHLACHKLGALVRCGSAGTEAEGRWAWRAERCELPQSIEQRG